MEFTPYTLLTDVGYLSVLLLLGKLIRAFLPFAGTANRAA